MFKKHIPQSTVYRLSIYLRELERLEEKDRAYISSRELGSRSGIGDDQIRKDLSYFGRFGKSRLGYPVKALKKNIRQILGVNNKTWHVAIVGLGNLGTALSLYKGFQERGFLLRAIFDSDPGKIGRSVADLKVEDVKSLVSSCKRENIDIGIVTVSARRAQEVADLLTKAGVKAILNFAPARINLLPQIKIKNVDLTIELENISFYLANQR
jgi:redox-sensing transcriptional repressor